MSGPFQGGSDPPKVSAIVVSYNAREELLGCVGSLSRQVRLPLEVVVVDNASTDGSAEALRRAHPTARVLENEANRGFSAANNQGLRASTGRHVLVLNPDAEVTAGAVETLSAALDARPEVGIVGPRTLNPDGSAQVSFGPDLSLLSEWRQRRLVNGVRARRPDALEKAAARTAVEQEPDWVSGSCFLARRAALEAVGAFDERFFLYEEDADLCRRFRAAGWRVLFTPASEVRHALGRSMAQLPGRARMEYHRSHLHYYRKHNDRLQTALLRAYFVGLGLRAWLSPQGGDEAPGLFRLGLGGK